MDHFKLASMALLFMLTSCKVPGGQITCPELRQYSPAFLKAASAELTVIENTAPHVVTMINDLGVDRDAVRKCIKLRSKARG